MVVLWDCDGTLVDRAAGDDEFVRRALESAGVAYDRLDPESLRRAGEVHRALQDTWRTERDEEAGWQEIAGVMLEGSGTTVRQARLFGRRLALYDDVYAPVPGMPGLLADLRVLGIRQGVVSNWLPSLPRFLQRHGLAQYFDVIVVSALEGVAKPDPTMFLVALRRMRVTASKAIMVGNDLHADIGPARLLGMRAVHFDPRRLTLEADAHEAAELRGRLLGLLGLTVP